MNLAGRKVKVFHMAIGADLIGAKTSMHFNKNIDLTATDQGILMISKASKRTVVIPYSNIKCFELIDEQEATIVPKKIKTANVLPG